MKLIQQISASARQAQIIILDDGTRVELELYFRPMMYSWYIERLAYKGRVFTGLRVSTNPNVLHQLRNLLPFGLGCYTKDGMEPKLLQDFSSGYAKLYLLSKEECAEYAEYLSGQG